MILAVYFNQSIHGACVFRHWKKHTNIYLLLLYVSLFVSDVLFYSCFPHLFFAPVSTYSSLSRSSSLAFVGTYCYLLAWTDFPRFVRRIHKRVPAGPKRLALGQTDIVERFLDGELPIVRCNDIVFVVESNQALGKISLRMSVSFYEASR